MEGGTWVTRDQGTLRASGRILGGGCLRHYPLPATWGHQSQTASARPGGGSWKVAFQSCSLYHGAVAQTRQSRNDPEGGALDLTYVPPRIALATYSWAQPWGCCQPCWTLSTLCQKLAAHPHLYALVSSSMD